jgi:hypothetical protein
MKGRHILLCFSPPNIFSTSPTHSVPAFEIAASILPAFIFIAFWLFLFFWIVSPPAVSHRKSISNMFFFFPFFPTFVWGSAHIPSEFSAVRMGWDCCWVRLDLSEENASSEQSGHAGPPRPSLSTTQQHTCAFGFFGSFGVVLLHIYIYLSIRYTTLSRCVPTIHSLFYSVYRLYTKL